MGMKHKLFIPKQAVGANLIYFDFFNATTSNTDIVVTSVLPIVSGAVTVTGVLGVDLLLTYTSAVGTGGTAATRMGTDITAATFTPMSPVASTLNAGVTARLSPSGGATASGILAYGSVFTEEAQDATYNGTLYEMLARSGELVIPKGWGFRVIQGAVASVGNIGFDVTFEATPR